MTTAKTLARHLEAVTSGKITKTNAIGIRKQLNAAWRNDRGYKYNQSTATGAQVQALLDALSIHHPTVTGELHNTGLKILRSPRYAKRLKPVSDIIWAEYIRFDLVRFDNIHRGPFAPVYRVCGFNGSFLFRNIAWQSAVAYGLPTGPEILPWSIKRVK